MERLLALASTAATERGPKLTAPELANELEVRGYYRHTKIIATVGPATESREKIKRIIESGESPPKSSPGDGTAAR